MQQLSAIVAQVCDAHGLRPADLEGVYIHAGNGRLPALLARKVRAVLQPDNGDKCHHAGG